jgi:putative drug exporter of the RND superfamily
MFAAWGRLIYRWRWVTLLGASLVLVLSIGLVARGGNLITGTDPTTTKLESVQADNLVSQELAPDKQVRSSFVLIFKSASLTVDDPAFRQELDAALAGIRQDSRVLSVETPYSAAPAAAVAMRSKDRRSALALVNLKDKPEPARGYFPALLGEVRTSDFQVTPTGEVAAQRDFFATTQTDLARAELFSLPVALLLLVVVFGAVVAGLLPIGVGGMAVVGGTAGTLLLSQYTGVSTFALDIVSLIGLGIAIDYSLFVVNRFREERAAGADMEAAMAGTLNTAGRAVTFSGITVAIGISGMLFFQGTFLASIGAAGTIVVAITVFYGLTFLPALLAVLGDNVDRLHLPIPRSRDGRGVWHALATWVMRRPVAVLVPSVALLLVASLPFTQLRMGVGYVRALPVHAQSRQGYETLQRDFPNEDQSSFTIVVDYPDGTRLRADHIGAIYDLSRRLAATPDVLRVESIVDLDPGISRSQYQAMYSGPRTALPPAAQQALATSTGTHIVVLQAFSHSERTSDQAREVVRAIRADPGVGVGGRVVVSGFTATDLDLLRDIEETAPLAIGFVVLVTFVLLLLLTGSLVLPLKAVIVNLLSISASFGAVVWIFQDGHLSSVLGFTAQSVDPSIPVIFFATVLGLSMDYEILLVSRIQEEYRRTGDNTTAVALGLERSGRLITGAAAVMVAVFIGFTLSEIEILKAIGLGLAIAVAIDATIVRALIVPAVMRLLGHLNWWAPRPLARAHRRLLRRASPEPEPAKAV